MRLIAASCCFAILIAGSGTSFADSPRDFLDKAVRGDNSEMMLGKLAQKRGSSPDVRSYGMTLNRDHSKARQEVLAVGRRFGVRQTSEVMSEARMEEQKLNRLRGREFDDEFVSYMIDDHRKDIEEFRSESHERHGAVSQLAEKQLPTLEKHLQIATSLKDQSHDDRRGRGRDRNGH